MFLDFYGMTPFPYGPQGAADRFLNQPSAKLSANRTKGNVNLASAFKKVFASNGANLALVA